MKMKMLKWIVLLTAPAIATARLAKQRYFRLPDFELSKSAATGEKSDESQQMAAMLEEEGFWERVLQGPLDLSHGSGLSTEAPTYSPTKMTPAPSHSTALCTKDGRGNGKKDSTWISADAKATKKATKMPVSDYCGKATKSTSPGSGKKESRSPSKAGGKKEALISSSAPTEIEPFDVNEDFIVGGINNDHHSSGSNDEPANSGKKATKYPNPVNASTKAPGKGYVGYVGATKGKKTAHPIVLVKKTDAPDFRGIELTAPTKLPSDTPADPGVVPLDDGSNFGVPSAAPRIGDSLNPQSPVSVKASSKAPKTKSISVQPSGKGGVKVEGISTSFAPSKLGKTASPTTKNLSAMPTSQGTAHLGSLDLDEMTFAPATKSSKAGTKTSKSMG